MSQAANLSKPLITVEKVNKTFGDNQVLRDDVTTVTWEHSHVVVGDDGLVVTFCIYEAPGEDECEAVCSRLVALVERELT